MKSHFVEDLLRMEIGQTFQSLFRLKNPQILQKQNGDPFLRLLLADKTGEIEAKWWDGREHHLTQAQGTHYALICGRTDLYTGKRQVIIQGVSEWTEQPENLADFLAVAALPLGTLCERLQGHIASVQSPILKALLDGVFSDAAFRQRFDQGPGAKMMHHSCRHGLLQHTLEVTDLASAMADAQRSWGYPLLSRDLVVAGALLHDIGKVHEITEDSPGDYRTSRTGEMLGHITIGLQWASKKINAVAGFPAELRDALLHIIASHHGRREFGSPIPPMFAEAQIIHAADLLNVQLYYIQEATQAATEDFVKVWKLENQRIYARPWESLDAAPATGAMTPDAPSLRGPDAALPLKPHGTLPALRFRTASGNATDNSTFRTRRLPLIGRAAAGMPQFAEQHIEDHYEVEDEGLPSGVNYLLQVDGDSMTGDGILNGDMVLVHRQVHQEPEDIAVVFFDDRNEAAIKRVRQTEAGGVELLSSNPANPPIAVTDPSSLRICGRVVGVLRH